MKRIASILFFSILVASGGTRLRSQEVETVDGQGNIQILDAANSRIQKFGPDGRPAP